MEKESKIKLVGGGISHESCTSSHDSYQADGEERDKKPLIISEEREVTYRV